jgi:uncharacterized membrane-anchored protein YitT (DUF2179 family)
MGMIMLISDAVLVAAAMLFFRSIESGLYAVITIFVSGRVVDLILYGSLEGKLLLIFSEKYDDISKRILTAGVGSNGRGVTLLRGIGGYSGAERNVVSCEKMKNEYARIKRKIAEIDPFAFIIIANASEVLGEGFCQLTDNVQ